MALNVKNKPEEKKSGDNEAMKILAKLQENYGTGVGNLGNTYAPVGRVPSGVFPIDLALGGGFPLYRISQLWGQESSGKSAVGLKLLGMTQRVLKRRVVLIDMEHVYDADWTAQHGVNTKDLILIQPENAEQAVDAAEGFMNADDVGMVLLDSLATMQPQKWVEAEVGKQAVGGNTQIVSSLYTKVGSAITRQQRRESPVLFVVVNQMRYKVGFVMGDPSVVPGGMSAKHGNSILLRLYGKKVMQEKVVKDMPTHLDVSGSVVKWRVPIIGNSFQFNMCLSAHEGWKVGDIMGTWRTVGSRLQASGSLKKEGKDWTCLGIVKHTLEEIETHYYDNEPYRLKCQKAVIEEADKIKAQK